MRRRASLATIVAGLTCLAASMVGITTAHAAAAPGSGFQSLGLSAVGGGQRIIFTQKETGQPDGAAEGDVPYGEASLTGSVGRALSSVAWPGALGGNLGSLLLVAGPAGTPSQVTALNTPVRAQAQTSSGSPTVTNNTVPGTTMAATAKDDQVIADATIAGSRNATVGTFGGSHVLAKTVLTGATMAVVDASSVTEDISLGGGQITIGSVTSIAHATTDGVHAASSGKTIVSDMKIGGVPVTVDQTGVHA